MNLSFRVHEETCLVIVGASSTLSVIYDIAQPSGGRGIRYYASLSGTAVGPLPEKCEQ